MSSDDLRFASKTQTIANHIFRISSNISQIQRHNDIIGTTKDTHVIRQKIHDLTDQTKDLIKQTTESLRELEITGSPLSVKQKTMEQQKLSRDFNNVLNRFQQIKKQSIEKEKGFIQTIKQQEVPEESQLEQSQLLLNVDHNEQLILEREQDIKEIERGIVEINEIFRDLGSIVTHQQTLLDNIEANVTQVAVNMDNARDELTSANRYQKSANTKLCWMFIVLVLAVVLIILIAV